MTFSLPGAKVFESESLQLAPQELLSPEQKAHGNLCSQA